MRAITGVLSLGTKEAGSLLLDVPVGLVNDVSVEMPVRWDLWSGHQKWTKQQWVTLRNVIELAEDS